MSSWVNVKMRFFLCGIKELTKPYYQKKEGNLCRQKVIYVDKMSLKKHCFHISFSFTPSDYNEFLKNGNKTL